VDRIRQFARPWTFPATDTVVERGEPTLRRSALAGCTAFAAAALLAVPATAPAASRCISEQDLDQCSEDVGQYSPAAGAVIHYLAHPEEIVVCVRECGPPTR
jgi:hypothetical protein